MGLFLEIFEVKIQHKPNLHRSRKEEAKASTFPTNLPPPHLQPWPNPLGHVSTCVTKLGRKHAWRVGKHCPSCGGTQPGTCWLWGIRIPELVKCTNCQRGQAFLRERKGKCHHPQPHHGELQEETSLQEHLITSFGELSTAALFNMVATCHVWVFKLK